ncbi:hypothetical protein [Pandoraea fibrosis]|uniref:Uncharacterized protein n=1 Tax=Pandoraea fibrosis TaxID=1891094 RepID=A0A5E4VN34_9BURK|nr:hypothetical protein [Pandoraea fibrosis]QHE91694.1 hypothetical protein PJ20_007665 [Pandoraea fibrosis]QHF14748.1 hypothetical protein PI93_020335 [Pandoraea fibrosis]VVE13611.1 hypothetical protein PFI31113_02739 [Pandoraea fibrosis]
MWYQQCAGASGWHVDRRATLDIEFAGMREATVPHRAERTGFGERLAHAANTTHSARRHGVDVSRRVDPEMARAFTQAWAGLWVSTGPCQHFYRKEFDLAHKRDARLEDNRARAEAMLAPTHAQGGPDEIVPDVSDGVALEQVHREIAQWLETVAATGHRGWHFRGARDALSLVGNLSMLAIIAACFHRQGATAGDDASDTVRGAAVANTPFGVPWADWTLLAFEGAKGVITQSLGSPTLIRHHAVDEVLKRMDAGCRLLEACVAMPPPAAAASWRNTLGRLTRARDVATLFTFANTAIPPARLGLWMPSWFANPPAEINGYRGILRVAGLMLDSCRAVTSLLGTWARNAAFTHDAQRLTHRWQSLCARLADVQGNDQPAVLRRVACVTQLATHCDTSLLTTIAANDALREHLLASGDALTASEIARACRQFDVECHTSCVDGATYLSLNPAESPWGQRWKDDAWQWGGATPARASYRLLLGYQHWSSGLLERAVSSSCMGATPAESSFDDPAGIKRTRTGVAHVDIESTRV